MGHIQSLPLSSFPFPYSQLGSHPFSSLFEMQITESTRKLSQRKSHSSKNLNEVVEQVRLASGESNPRQSKQQLQSPSWQQIYAPEKAIWPVWSDWENEDEITGDKDGMVLGQVEESDLSHAKE